MLRRLALTAVAGAALAAVFEPLAWAWLMPLSVAAFAVLTRGLTARRGFVVGLVFGACFYFPHIYWMSESIGPPAWLLLAATETFFYGLVGAASPGLQRLPGWPVWLAAAWAATELWRSDWPWSGMPWGRLAYGVVDTPVAPLLAYVGVPGVSFCLALVSFLLAAAITARTLRSRLVVGGATAVVAGLIVLPALTPYSLQTTGSTTVAVVQGNVPPPENDILANFRQVTANHVEETEQLARDVESGTVEQPDFVIWPENSTAVDPVADRSTNEQITRAVTAIGVPILVGAIVDDGPDKVLNQGIVWDPRTGPGERYAKRHPVAFGEYIPLRSLLPDSLVNSGQLARIPRDMQSGSRSTPLPIAGVQVADAICFDVAYDDGFYDQVGNGAQLLAVQTSNASFIFTDQIDQQFAITRLRAIESGRALTLASANGITAIIGPDGDVIDDLPDLTQGVLVETVPLKAGQTPGVRTGRVLLWALPVTALLGLGLSLVQYRRGSSSARREEPTQATEGAPQDR